MGVKGNLFIGGVLLVIGIIMGIITILQLKSSNKTVVSFIIISIVFIALGVSQLVAYFKN